MSALVALAGCGSKTGLEAPLPPPCSFSEVLPADCERITRGEPMEIDGERPRERWRFDAVHDGIFGYTLSRTEITFFELDAEGTPLATPASFPAPPHLEGLTTRTSVDGCLPVYSFHYAPGLPPFSPGPCAFYVRGASTLRVLPGNYDRCVVTASDTDGLRFALRLGEREELRRVGVDGTFLDREPVSVAEPSPDASLELGAVRSGVFFDRTFAGVDIVSPAGRRTTVSFGGTPTSVLQVLSALLWVVDGTVFSVEIDASGEPMLPPRTRLDFGSDVLSLDVEEGGDGVWMLVQHRAFAELVRLDATLALVGAPERLTVDFPVHTLTDRGLVVIGQSEGRLVSVPYACVD